MHVAHNGNFRKKKHVNFQTYILFLRVLANVKIRKSMFRLWATLLHSFKARYYALPPIIGCADMPRGAAMPRLPLHNRSIGPVTGVTVRPCCLCKLYMSSVSIFVLSCWYSAGPPFAGCRMTANGVSRRG